MPSKRGFAAMDSSKQREIASKGGRAAHQDGTAHEFSADEERAAGRKGGERVSQNRSHMAEIGRKGGEARGAARRAQAQIRGHQDDASSESGQTAVLDEEREGEGLVREGGLPVEAAGEDLDRD